MAFFKTNVCDENNVNELLSFCLHQFGRVDGLVNCAGIVIPEKLIDKEGSPHKLSTFEKTINVNLVGTFNTSRIIASHMAKHKNESMEDTGVIINTASVAAFEGQIGQTSYSASKAAIVGMTLPMARELSPFGIRVVTIAPGIFETPMLASLPDKVKASLGAQVPFPPRLGKTQEFASLVSHIIENQMLNGETIRLDGAIRMGAR